MRIALNLNHLPANVNTVGFERVNVHHTGSVKWGYDESREFVRSAFENGGAKWDAKVGPYAINDEPVELAGTGGSKFVSAKNLITEHRLAAQRYLPRGSELWLMGAGSGPDRDHAIANFCGILDEADGFDAVLHPMYADANGNACVEHWRTNDVGLWFAHERCRTKPAKGITVSCHPNVRTPAPMIAMDVFDEALRQIEDSRLYRGTTLAMFWHNPTLVIPGSGDYGALIQPYIDRMRLAFAETTT